MLYYIYEIKNLINNKTYVGRSSHTSLKRDRNYYGSGLAIKNAIKKYGKDNFKKTIIIDNIKTLEETIKLEEETILKYKNNNQAEYNLSEKGYGNDSSILSFKGLKHTEEWKKQASIRLKNIKRKPHTEEWKKQNSERMKKISIFVSDNPSFKNPKWFTNGEKDIFVPIGKEPEGFYRGRSKIKGKPYSIENIRKKR